MDHTEQLSRYTANFVDELFKSGMTDAVISPGSRSTPLAMTINGHSYLNTWVLLDERSAAFFALGLAKKMHKPVALICTSGTAAANYYPAIIEAYYSRTPLIVLTADRPHELRDVGAPQAIGQLNLYGDYVKWFQEMALPEADNTMLSYARNKASRAVHTANTGNPGPVHLNFPYREPLLPDLTLEKVWGDETNRPFFSLFEGERHLGAEQADKLKKQLQSLSKGLIVCGPQTDPSLASAITDLAEKWQIPILADPLSQVRAGKHSKHLIIESYDAFLRNETIRTRLKPDFIIRFGAMPVSKAYLFYVKEHSDIPQYVVENIEGYREPAGNRTVWVYADAVSLCRRLANKPVENADQQWLMTWQKINKISKDTLNESDDDSTILTEGGAIQSLVEVLPDESSIYIGNSMAVRDLDTFFMTTSKKINVLSNRGANGIDGMVSSGLGASASGRSVTLVLGDLSFFHDMNGLLAAKHYGLNITILVINNNGGGIFSFLPHAEQEETQFEALFGTPLNIDFYYAVQMYGGMYRKPKTYPDLEQALHDSHQYQGLSVVEIRTERSSNKTWHLKKWEAIESLLLENEV